MYSPEQIDALIAERDRLRAELDHAQTLLAEWEAVVGMPLVTALNEACERVETGQPYTIVGAHEALRGAFHKIAEDRNKWRAQAKRAAP